jgi:hypothetical protein
MKMMLMLGTIGRLLIVSITLMHYFLLARKSGQNGRLRGQKPRQTADSKEDVCCLAVATSWQSL